MNDDRRRALRSALAGSDDLRFSRAPGRVNLIGDHTDYNDGFVLPLAIDRDCTVTWRPRTDGRVSVRSLDLGGSIALAADGGDDPARIVAPGWGRFVAGVLRARAQAGHPAVGIDAALSSTVPVGSGLSSSSALGIALLLALGDAARFEVPARQLALVGQEAERLATGVRGGLMDQLVSLCGRSGHALFIDCRGLDVEPVALPPDQGVLVVHSGVSRTLAGSAYAQRRVECEDAARRLGLQSLRDATPDQVADLPRARHVVNENQRVLDAVAALQAGDVDRLGRLLRESHASLRDDYEASTPELDLLVELLIGAGARGARLTGAGWGGCVIALVDDAEVSTVAATVTARYRDATGLEPHAFRVRAVDGARPLA